jgi:hypothetical protein
LRGEWQAGLEGVRVIRVRVLVGWWSKEGVRARVVQDQKKDEVREKEKMA